MTLLVFLWALDRKKSCVIIGLLGEAVLYYLAAKTSSRGALIALGAAAAYFLMARGFETLKEKWLLWSLRIIIVGCCVFSTGFYERLAPQNLTGDGSVVNRLALWRSGLAMVAGSPLKGWGVGESGQAYMNWFQAIDHTEGYTTMVNSYLHIAVEYGLMYLFIVVVVITWLLLIGWLASRSRDDSIYAKIGMVRGFDMHSIVSASGAAVVAWAVANGFTTLWIEPKLWVVPGLGAAILICQIRYLGRQLLFRSVLISGALSIVMISILLSMAVYFRRDDNLLVKPGACGTIVAQGIDRVASPVVWHVWPDTVVLGRSPGKELRRWLSESRSQLCLVIYPVTGRSDFSTAADVIDCEMLFGRQCARFRKGYMGPRAKTQLCLVHPTVPPPPGALPLSAPPQSITLILPEVDEAGLNAIWRVWAEHNHARVVFSSNVGFDIRAAWPQVVQKIGPG